MQVDKETTVSRVGTRNDARKRQAISCSGNTFVVRLRLVEGHVAEAWSSGRMMRNMNVLLQGGLDEQGKPRFVQQAHCICNDAHALAAVRALEALAGAVPPRNALLVRSIVQALRCIQDHLLHVYQFHLSDWADLERALRADPARAALLAEQPGQDQAYFRQALDRVRFMSQGEAAELLSGPAPGHPDYRGPDEQHLLLLAHALESLQMAARLYEAFDLLGCRGGVNPAYQMGGLSEDMDLGSRTLDQLREILVQCSEFVSRTFLPDLERLARAQPHWADQGAGPAFLASGDYVQPFETGLLFPEGVVRPEASTDGHWALSVEPLRAGDIREEREPRWNEENRRRYRLRDDDDNPLFAWGEGEYVWLPAPRHGPFPGGQACEVGALARMLSAWAQGREPVRRVMRDSLEACGLPPKAMNSTLGRILARGQESLVLARAGLDWLDELESALARGDRTLRAQWRLPSSGLGTGRVEVARGALTHTIRIEDDRIVSHDYLIPSLWNFSPRDSSGVRGPMEQALLGSPIADPDHPLEALRTVHAFDPCNASHLVVEDQDSGRTIIINAK